jgi:hypothetical protein
VIACIPRDDVERLLAHRPPDAARPPERRAAAAIILRPAGPAAELLPMTRAEHAPDPWSGQVSPRGAGWPRQDSDLPATAVRETKVRSGWTWRARLPAAHGHHAGRVPARGRGRGAAGCAPDARRQLVQVCRLSWLM